MKNSDRYFKNTECKYYPCHDMIKGGDFNCLFCYCPLNCYDDCPGTPKFIKMSSGKTIKDCKECTFPHEPENYDRIIKFLKMKNI